MGIEYICYDCRKNHNCIKTGFHAVNEVGRKKCSICGSREDNLNVIDREEFIKISPSEHT